MKETGGKKPFFPFQETINFSSASLPLAAHSAFQHLCLCIRGLHFFEDNLPLKLSSAAGKNHQGIVWSVSGANMNIWNKNRSLLLVEQ